MTEKYDDDKVTKKVYSARINENIRDRFISECKRLNIPHAYVISECMKHFVVVNIDTEDHEPAKILGQNKHEYIDTDEREL